MRYEFITNKNGCRFLWTYDSELFARFAMSNLKLHGEYGLVGPLTVNLIDEPVLGLIYLGDKYAK